MYKAFYGLREKPFNLTPDPRFLYLSDKHKEAFAHLLYGIRSRSGFVMVTGEIGTGKTTICRNLLNQLDEDTEVAFIFNPMLSPLELLRKIVSEFGIDVKGSNALEMTEELNEYLLEAAAKGKNCVLLIDEAQNLDPQVLEQIRLLSNLETETEKLLQIVLIGQPELGEKLELHELRQLNQRITARYHLKPLSEKEVMQYVAYRLHVAGGRRSVKFAKPAVRAVYKISKGTPRVINAICDRALLIGFTRETHTITKGIVHRAHREIRGDAIFGRQAQKWSFRQWALHPVSAVIALCIAVAVFLNSPTLQSYAHGMADKVAAAFASDETPAPTPEPPRNVAEAKTVNEVDDNILKSEIIAPPVEAPAGTPVESVTPAPEAAAPQIPVASGLAVTDLEATLAGLPPAETDGAALRALLASWGKPAENLPSKIDDAAIDRVLRTDSWTYDRLKPALDQLVALDLPALVKVVVEGEARWVSLSAAKGDLLTVSAGDGAPVQVSRDGLQKIYAAEAIVPWSDPARGSSALREGQSGPAVAELKEKLRKLDRLRAENTSDAFDVETASAVSRLQAETSLHVDGIAGPQVRMVLSSWLRENGAPSLGDPRPVPATETVASKAASVPAPSAKSEIEQKPEAKTAPAVEKTPPAPAESAAAPEMKTAEDAAKPEEPATPVPVPSAAQDTEPAEQSAEKSVAKPEEPATPAPTPSAAQSTEPVVQAEEKTGEKSASSVEEAPVAEAKAPLSEDNNENAAESSPGDTEEAATVADTTDQPVESGEPVPESEAPLAESSETQATESLSAPEPVTLTNVNRESDQSEPEAVESETAAETPASSTGTTETITSVSGVQVEIRELVDPGSLPKEEAIDTENGDDSNG